jgi:hypothetical protein
VAGPVPLEGDAFDIGALEDEPLARNRLGQRAVVNQARDAELANAEDTAGFPGRMLSTGGSVCSMKRG